MRGLSLGQGQLASQQGRSPGIELATLSVASSLTRPGVSVYPLLSLTHSLRPSLPRLSRVCADSCSPSPVQCQRSLSPRSHPIPEFSVWIVWLTGRGPFGAPGSRFLSFRGLRHARARGPPGRSSEIRDAGVHVSGLLLLLPVSWPGIDPYGFFYFLLSSASTD